MRILSALLLAALSGPALATEVIGIGQLVAVPEPGSLALLAIGGVAGLAALRKRK